MLTNRKFYSTLFQRAIQHTNVLHITDPEGTKFFFDAVKRSKIVSLHPDKGLQFNKTSNIPFFIFGGDATDRGPYDLTITELLVDFKKRHPENVALLVGNREIKNNRIKIELAANLIRERLLNTKPARWLPAHLQTVPTDYLKSKFSYVDDNDLRESIARSSIEECQNIYLHWMFENNMGCPSTYYYRLEELERNADRLLSSSEPLQSFIKETSPTGLMGEYLKLGQMGVIVPNTRILAVHGGLTPFNIGRIPGMAANTNPIANARQWIDKLNTWYAKQIQLWCEFEPTTLTEPACTALDEAVLPIAGKPKHVVTADMLNAGRQFAEIPDEVSDYLLNNQISLVLTGHQPCGDHPAILRNKLNNLLFINADTGYADFKPGMNDTRGSACHSLEILADNNITNIAIDATTAKGLEIKTNLVVTPDVILREPYIGKLLDDGHLVQCKLPTGEYRLAKQEGFTVSYKNISVRELAMQLTKHPLNLPSIRVGS